MTHSTRPLTQKEFDEFKTFLFSLKSEAAVSCMSELDGYIAAKKISALDPGFAEEWVLNIVGSDLEWPKHFN